MPFVDDAGVRLEEICLKALYEEYGQSVEQNIMDVLTWELKAVKATKSESLFLAIGELLDNAGLASCQVGYKGDLGASFVAYLCGITCINPMKTELCGREFFYGYDGNKTPVIRLEIPFDVKEKVWAMCSGLEGIKDAVHAGYSACVTEQDAKLILCEYEQENGIVLGNEMREEWKDCFTQVLESRGIMHQGEMLLVPEGYDIHSFTPLMDSVDGKHAVTVTDANKLPLYKIGLDSSYAVNMTYQLMNKTGVNVFEISLEDKEVLHMFRVYETEYGFQSEAVGVPEFQYDRIFGIVKDFEPDCFEDIVKIIGLAHSQTAWNMDLKLFLDDYDLKKEDIISSKEDVYEKLVKNGMERKDAVHIAENVGKGNKLSDEEKAIMMKHNISEWYLELCDEIESLSSRAHAYRAALNAWWCAWFKLHYPNEFYETYFKLWKLNCGRGFANGN